MENIYEYIGVSKNADKKTIKSAYKKKAKLVHPDTLGTDEEFKKLKLYYDILMDNDKRFEYDNLGIVVEDESIFKTAIDNLKGIYLNTVENQYGNNVLEQIYTVVNHTKKQKERELERCDMSIQNHKELSKKFVTESEINIFLGFSNDVIKQLMTEKRIIKNQLKLINYMSEILSNYSFNYEKKEVKPTISKFFNENGD